jgi:hypothetical protein
MAVLHVNEYSLSNLIKKSVVFMNSELPRRSAHIRAELIRQAIVGEAAPPADSPLRIDSHGASLDGAAIDGRLDLTSVEYSRPIAFTRCTFDDRIDVSGAKLDTLTLRDCRAPGIDAVATSLRGDLIISGGQLVCPGGLAFNGPSMSIGGSLMFVDDSLAVGAVSFALANISGRVVCNGTFRNPLAIASSFDWYAPLYSAINGFGATVGQSLGFGTKLNATGEPCVEGFVILANAKIGTGIYFVSGSITRGAQAGVPQECDIQGDPSTRFAIKSGAAFYLHNVEAGELVLTNFLCFEGLLSLRGARLGTIADDGTLWRDSKTGLVRKGVALDLDGCTYSGFTGSMSSSTRMDWRTRLSWLKTQIPEYLSSEFHPQPFTQCAQVMRSMGDLHGSHMVLLERERLRLRSPKVHLWERLTGRLLGLVAGHGYKSYYALYWALAVWLVGGVIFSVADRLGQMRPASEHVLVDDSYRRTGEIPKDYEPLKPFLYSADILLPIVDIGQEKFWLPRDSGERPANAATAFPHAPRWVASALNWLFGGWIQKTYYYFEIAMGWLLVSIALAGFSGHLGHKGEE